MSETIIEINKYFLKEDLSVVTKSTNENNFKIVKLDKYSCFHLINSFGYYVSLKDNKLIMSDQNPISFFFHNKSICMYIGSPNNIYTLSVNLKILTLKKYNILSRNNHCLTYTPSLYNIFKKAIHKYDKDNTFKIVKYYNIVMTYHNLIPACLVKELDNNLITVINTSNLFVNSNILHNNDTLCISYNKLNENSLSTIKDSAYTLGLFGYNTCEDKVNDYYILHIKDRHRDIVIYENIIKGYSLDEIYLFYTEDKLIEMQRIFNLYKCNIEIEITVENKDKKIKKEYILDSYYNVGILGKGSFGEVYHCKDNITNEDVVVKIIKDSHELEVSNLEYIRSHEYNSKYLPNLIKIEEKNTIVYIITDYLHNYIPLSKMIEHFRSDINISNYPEIKQHVHIIISEMCNGLKELHKMNIAHNDIKPDNIMINFDTNEVKYIDFGMSCHNDKQCSGDEIINYNIMSRGSFRDPLLIKKTNPITDKIKGFLKPNQQGDIWSLGICIYMIIIGKTPLELSGFSKENYFKKYNFNNDINMDTVIDYLREGNKTVVNIKKMLSLNKTRTIEK